MVADMFGFPFRIVSTQEVAVVFRSDCRERPCKFDQHRSDQVGWESEVPVMVMVLAVQPDNSRHSPHVLFIAASGIKKRSPCEALHASNSACAIARGSPSTLALPRCVMKAVAALLV